LIKEPLKEKVIIAQDGDAQNSDSPGVSSGVKCLVLVFKEATATKS
jgi:hypothetical protein